ncbi:uncharacterized protein LOC143908449 [Temnothorax americanus]|uniref:uncharacterized protein LOC143908449 n=1 Tax=Temnothorax americanus TaxID=1964332 RepID=UPI004068537F
MSETKKLLQNRSFIKNSVSRKTLQTQNYIHDNASQLENVRKSKESASDSSSDSLFEAQTRNKKNKTTNHAIVSDDSQSDDETRSDRSKRESPASSGIVPDDGEKNPMEQLDGQADKNENNDILQPETFNQLRTYFDRKFEDLQIIMVKKIRSAKRSILYDVKARSEKIKMIIGTIKIAEKPQGTRAELKEKLEINLPIETLPDFLKFEEELRTNEDKKKGSDGSSVDVFRFFQYQRLYT